MKTKGYEHYYSLLRFLRRNVVLDYPLKVTRCKLPSDRLGDSDFRNEHFYIRIDKNLEMQQAIEILIHEMSHIVSWMSDNHHTEHGPKWGLAYSMVYRHYLAWLETD